MQREQTFRVMGIFFLVVALIQVYFTLKYDTAKSVFDTEEIFFLFFAIILILQNEKLAYGQFLISILDLFPWMVDFISFAFTRHTFFQIAGTLSGGTSFVYYFLALKHMFVLPILFLFIMQKGPQEKAKSSILYYLVTVIPILSISYFFTTVGENFNCARYSCILPQTDLPLVNSMVATILIGVIAIIVVHKMVSFIYQSIQGREDVVGNTIIIATLVLTAMLLIHYPFLPQLGCTIESSAPVDARCVYFDDEISQVHLRLKNPLQIQQCVQVSTFDEQQQIQLDPNQNELVFLFIPALESNTYVNIRSC